MKWLIWLGLGGLVIYLVTRPKAVAAGTIAAATKPTTTCTGTLGASASFLASLTAYLQTEAAKRNAVANLVCASGTHPVGISIQGLDGSWSGGSYYTDWTALTNAIASGEAFQY